MMKQVIIFLVISIIVLACGDNEDEATRFKTDNILGANTFTKNCIICHGRNGNLQLNGAKDLATSTLSLEERILLINNGRKTMTAFKGILNDKKIEAVAKYTIERFNQTDEQ